MSGLWHWFFIEVSETQEIQKIQLRLQSVCDAGFFIWQLVATLANSTPILIMTSTGASTWPANCQELHANQPTFVMVIAFVGFLQFARIPANRLAYCKNQQHAAQRQNHNTLTNNNVPLFILDFHALARREEERVEGKTQIQTREKGKEEWESHTEVFPWTEAHDT